MFGLPRNMDPRRSAAQGLAVAGRLDASRLPRLAELCRVGPEGVRAELRFFVDDQGVACAEGRLDAIVEVVCQRCLEPLALVLHSTAFFAFVDNEEQMATLPASYEGVMIDDRAVAIHPLIEDELLLQLPYAPCHAASQCVAPGSTNGDDSADRTGDQPRAHPFAQLRALREQKKEDEE